jgi:hypothetical protein
MIPLLLLWLAAGEPAGTIQEANLRQLLAVHRVYVDRMTGGETAAQMREILISTLQETGLFIVTENQERADTFLRGGAEDLVFTDVHSSSDSVNAHGSLSTRSGGYTRTSSGTALAVGGGDSESEHSAERRHEAIAAVRLVNKDGDVIWATTQESLGAKFRGASADVAEKITAKLKEDFEKAKKVK